MNTNMIRWYVITWRILAVLWIASIGTVLWAIKSTPFIRFQETQIWTSVFFLVFGVIIGILSICMIGIHLAIKLEGMSVDDTRGVGEWLFSTKLPPKEKEPPNERDVVIEMFKKDLK